MESDKPKETMQEAFLRQHDIDDAAADRREKAEKKVGYRRVLRALRQQAEMPKMREALKPPTRLPEDSHVARKAEPKPGEKGFTEINRWKHIGGKTVTPGEGVDDGLIEMGDMGSEDVQFLN